ncbi:DMT family protein, partial [Streptomyces sp. OR43]
MSVLVIVLSVSAACCLGFGFVLQQAAARHAPKSDYLSPRLLLDLMRVRSWLAGIGLMVCGMVLGALALGKGEVSVVEPLLATNLLFAMALSRHRTGQRLGRGQCREGHPQRARLERALYEDQPRHPQDQHGVRLPAGDERRPAAVREALPADPGQGVLESVQQSRRHREQRGRHPRPR